MNSFGPVAERSNPNSRETKLRAFLGKPPKRADKLVMAAAADEGAPILLGEWMKAEFSPELAPQILDLLDEHALEIGGGVTCELSYRDAHGATIATLVLKRQANHIESPADMAVASIQGDARSLVVNAQAQSLLVQKLYVGGMGQVLAMSKEIASRADDQAHRYLRRVVELEHEIDQLKDALRAAEEIAAAAQGEEKTPTTDAQLRALKLFETLAPVLVQRLLGAVAGGPNPAAPPS